MNMCLTLLQRLWKGFTGKAYYLLEIPILRLIEDSLAATMPSRGWT